MAAPGNGGLIPYSPPTSQSALELGPSHCPNGHLGQDLDFGGFAFALKLPELLNTNLPTVRAKLGQTSSFPIMGPNRAMNLGAQLGPMRIIKLSPNWACQMGPIHCPKFLLSGMSHLNPPSPLPQLVVHGPAI